MGGNCPASPLHYEWSRSTPILPKNHIVSSDFAFAKPFIPSYEKECRPNIHYLLGWEYYRIWRCELNQYIEAHKEKTKKKKIKIPKFNKPKPKEETKAKTFKMKKFEKVAGRTDHKGKNPKELRKNNTSNKKDESGNKQTSNFDNYQMENVAPYTPSIIPEKIGSAKSVDKQSERSPCSTRSSTRSKTQEEPETKYNTNIPVQGDPIVLEEGVCACICFDANGNLVHVKNCNVNNTDRNE